jgi:hypothetical protein
MCNAAGRGNSFFFFQIERAAVHNWRTGSQIESHWQLMNEYGLRIWGCFVLSIDRSERSLGLYRFCLLDGDGAWQRNNLFLAPFYSSICICSRTNSPIRMEVFTRPENAWRASAAFFSTAAFIFFSLWALAPPLFLWNMYNFKS